VLEAAGRHLRGIEDDEAEISCLQDERERLEGAIERALIQLTAQAGMGHDLAAHPQQPRQIDARRIRRRHVEHVEDIDERDDLAPGCGRRKHPEEYARATRRSRTDDLRDLPARKPAAQPHVQRRNTGRSRGVFISTARGKRWKYCRKRPIQLPVAEKGFEIGAC
jgi:hypothetical protein